jgi:addiction module HigA family antidote
MSQMHSPPHPGLTLKEDVLPALRLSVTQAAEQLGVSRVMLSNVINGRAAISTEMAARLERWLGVEFGGRAELWLAQQAAHDLWQLRQQRRRELARVRHAAIVEAAPEMAEAA